MVEIADLSFVLAGASVCVAAFYYIFHMRYTMKSREMETLKYLTEFMLSETRLQSFGIVYHQLEWKDWKDFKQKYWDSNPEMYARINSLFGMGNELGYIVRNKLASAERLYDLGGWAFLQLWNRYSGYFYWRREQMSHITGRDFYRNFEFLAQEMKKINDSRRQTQEQMKPISQKI